MAESIITGESLFINIRSLIEESRKRVAVTVNNELTLLYWNVGNLIQQEILRYERAGYGQQVVKKLSEDLMKQYGKGWSLRHLYNCIKFRDVFPDVQIVHTLCTQLSWSHLRVLMGIEDELKRGFYVEICMMERWTVKLLLERIDSMLYERTAISKKPELTIKNDLQKLKNEGKTTPELVFRDPYFLDFLGLKDTYSEKDLESAIISELQRFIQEIGTDFAFIERQKRIVIDRRDYYVDLLFYHRRLKALVAIELKLGEFKAEYKDKMELYLSWLEKNETIEGESPPIGLILCAGKHYEHVELLQLHKSNIKVAEYLTMLPPKDVLLEKFHQAIELARSQIDVRGKDRE